jgi:hypothetical protein
MDGEEEQQNIPTYGCPMSEQLCAQVVCLIHERFLLQLSTNFVLLSSLHVTFIDFICFDGLSSHGVQLLGFTLGLSDAISLGFIDGSKLGSLLGSVDGMMLGNALGYDDGSNEGREENDGTDDGTYLFEGILLRVGLKLGFVLGSSDGILLCSSVGSKLG